MPVKLKRDDEDPEEPGSFKLFVEEHEFLVSFLIFIAIVAIIVLIGYHQPAKSTILSCGDGSFYNSCSITKPYYCNSNGSLFENASVCGCSSNESASGNSCTSSLQTQPKILSLSYILNGQEGHINFTAYGGLASELSKNSQIISYSGSQKPLMSDFIFSKINRQDQSQFLMPLIIGIQNITKDKVEQARIAVSIVQNTPYGVSNKTSSFFGTKVNYSRYPYQVIYDDEGICGEKSELLAFMLRELGYGTAIFYFPQENHEAVGIKCPVEDSYNNTGYCFVETTGPAIISDSSLQYAGGITLTSQPQITLVSTGISLPGNLPEYADARTMAAITQGRFVLLSNSKFNSLVQKYGLINEYQIA